MFEYLWNLPGNPSDHRVRLRIHSARGWIGRKTLSLDDRLILSRGRFAGIDHAFPHPEMPGEIVNLRAEPDSASRRWCIRLAFAGRILPELSGAEPPPTLHRPKLLSVVTGLTGLVMLIALIMLPHIWRMLSTVYSRSDTRVFVLDVVDPRASKLDFCHFEDRLWPWISRVSAGLRSLETPLLWTGISKLSPDLWESWVSCAEKAFRNGRSRAKGPRLQRSPLPQGIINQSYETRVVAKGGSPPYRLERHKGRLPPGLEFDAATATIRGLPTEAGEYLVWLRVADSSGLTTERPYAVSIRLPDPGNPQIRTDDLPLATVGEPYSATLEITGDPLPSDVTAERYEWTLNKSKLPKGLKADLLAGTIVGIPEAKTAGTYPLTARVVGSTYSPVKHLAPWGVPFVVTATCLLGFWNMRRWCVWLYGLLIVGQLALGFLAPDVLPLNLPAGLLQSLVFAVAVKTTGHTPPLWTPAEPSGLPGRRPPNSKR